MTDTAAPDQPTLRRESGAIPTPPRGRRGLGQRLREDLPILVLAAILSGYIWASARQEVLVTETLREIRVHADTGGRKYLRADPGKIELEFHCNKGIFEKIKSELEVNGIRLVIGTRPEQEPAVSRPFKYALGDRYVFDWQKYVVNLSNGELPLPTGTVTRQRLWPVPILPPEVPDLGALGIRVEVIEVEPSDVKFMGPATLFPRHRPQLRPNPIERSELRLDDLGEHSFERELDIPLAFDAWVEERLNEAGQPDPEHGLPDATRREVPLPNAVARVRLRRSMERKLSHTLRLTQSLADVERFRFEVEDSNHVDATPGATHLKATVVGTAAELDLLEKNLPLWHYSIDVPMDERAKLDALGEDLPLVKVKARLSLELRGVLNASLGNVELRPTPAQEGEFVLIARLRTK